MGGITAPRKVRECQATFTSFRLMKLSYTIITHLVKKQTNTKDFYGTILRSKIQ